MDLRKRLARFDALSRRPREADAVAPGAVPDPAAAAALGLSVAPGPAGDVWRRDEALRRVPRPGWPDDFERLDFVFTAPAPVGLRPGELLLLDTETTGLAGGAGTVAFLIGLGWWAADGRLNLRQYFLPSPGAEAAMLADLEALAAGFRVVVTYNGNGFDLPLLRTRGVLARRRGLLSHLVSWDLLPAVRRLWGRRLPDCRQPTAERLLTVADRADDDIDGALIPQTWFDFVRGGGVGDLPAVIRHNRSDLLGMADLLARTLAGASAVDEPRAAPADLPWRDAWSLARLAERRGLVAAAAAWIAAAQARRDRDPDDAGFEHAATPERFRLDAVRLWKRTGDWAEAARQVEAAFAELGPLPWLEREAAILYEHRLPDLERALDHARRLGDAHRIARLERRLGAAAAD